MNSIYDYDVYDRSGDKVGTVDNVWENDNHQIGFIGIRTGWLGLGKNHLIPADGIVIDESSRSVRTSYDEETIKNSPSFESTAELGEVVERDVYRHFGIIRGEEACYGDDTAYSGATTGYSDTWETSQRRANASGDTVEIPLAREEVHIDKQRRELGEVRLRKVVRTEVVNQPVELRHEDVVIERVRDAGGAPVDEAFTEDVVSIPISEEEAVVSKTVESAGAVRAKKVTETERKDVSETVREEDVEVERSRAGAHR